MHPRGGSLHLAADRDLRHNVLRARLLAVARPETVTSHDLVERAAEGTPHKGRVLLAVQAHSDDIPLMAAGTVAKLVKEGYTGYLLRATK